MRKDFTLGVTGHRTHLLPGYRGETSQALDFLLLRLAVEELNAWQPALVITGMATGWDLAIAGGCTVLGIPFRAAIPFVGQEKHWSQNNKTRYHTAMDEAAVVTVAAQSPSRDAYRLRDQQIVDHSDVMLALWGGDYATGTGQTVAYADAWLVPCNNVWDTFIGMLENETAPISA